MFCGHTDDHNTHKGDITAMKKLTKKEKCDMIAAAMKTISQHNSLSPTAKDRGVTVLKKALEGNSDRH